MVSNIEVIGMGQYFPNSSDWYLLPTLEKSFLVLLFLTAVYVLYFTLFIIFRLRSLRQVSEPGVARRLLLRLEHELKGLRQIIAAIFCLFGLTFFLQIQNAFFTPDSNRPVGLMILENFRDCFRFASFVFLTLFILHCLQWFASRRVLAALLRLECAE